MKKLGLLVLAILFFIACEKQEKRYTQNSSEIETVKKLVTNYTNKAYDMTIYADTSKTYYNTKVNAMTPAQTLAYHQANDAAYSSRSFLDKDQEYEMVLTDDGQTWVNCWLDWKGVLAGNGKEINMPVHLTYRFIDAKIVHEVGMWDPTEVVLGLQEIEAIKNMPVEEQAIQKTIQNITKAWNTNNQDLMKDNMASSMIRNSNGIKTGSNPEDYGKFMNSNFDAFSDFTVVLTNSMVKGNKAYINWVVTGTNTGSFNGNPATNKKIKLPGFSEWTFNSEGKAIQENAFSDNFFQQLGYTLSPPQ